MRALPTSLILGMLLTTLACQKNSTPDPTPTPAPPASTKTSNAPYHFVSVDPENTTDGCIDVALVDKDEKPVPMLQEVPRLLNPCAHNPQLAPTQAHFTYHQDAALLFVDIDAPAREPLTTLPDGFDSYDGKWSPQGTRWAIAISTDKGKHTHLWSWRFKEGKLTDLSRHKLNALTDCSNSAGVCGMGSKWEFQGEDTITYTGTIQDLEPDSHPASGQLIDSNKLTTVSVDLNAEATP